MSTEIHYYRGDSYPYVAYVTDTDTGNPIDLTAATLTMTVDSSKNPSDDSTKLFTVTGVLVDAANGEASFTPSTTNNDLSPGTYYYDIQIEQGTVVRTLVKDKYVITQDITKV